MASQETTEPTELVAELLGSDPWLRFDLWSGRAWQATESAIDIATNGSMVISDDGLDQRVVALFHAAQIAKDFSEMVNPLFAATQDSRPAAPTSDAQARAIMGMLLDDD